MRPLGYAVEVGRTKGDCGRVRRDDKALGRLVACLSAKGAGRNVRPQLTIVGDEAGAQTQDGEKAAAAVADGRFDLSGGVFDGITSVL